MKKLLLFIIVGLMVLLVSCSNSGVHVINAAMAKEMRDNDSSIILVDVREQSEYDESHIQGAKLFPLGNIEAEAETVLPDKTATYIIYCRSGNRSNQAANILVDLGYENIYDMGGIIDWPYETVS